MADVIIDLSKVMKGLAQAKANFEDMTPFFHNVADLELADTKLRFETQKDPDGKKWPDPHTIRKGGPDPKNPKKSGFKKRVRDINAEANEFGVSVSERDLAWNYVVNSNFHGIPNGWHWFDRGRGDKAMIDNGTLLNSISRAYGKDFAIVGTNLEYAEKLQTGRFPFIGVTSRTQDNIDEAMQVFLKGLFK